MKPLTSTFLAATTAGILWLGTNHAFAQDDAPPPPPPPPAEAGGSPGAGGPGGPGGPGGDRMEKFRQQMNERIKTQLKASDDEWAVIQPLLEKVQTKMRESMESRFGGMRGMGGPGGGGPRRAGGNNGGGGGNGGNTADANRPEANRQRPPGRGPTPEAQELMTTLQNDNASTNDIKTKLQALREQRKKSEAELAQSREDLKKVLTLRQEAILVSAGMLD